MVSPEINLEGQSTTLLPNTSSVPMPSETEKDNLNKSELTDNPSPLLSSPPVTTKPTTTSTPNRKIRKCDYEKCTFSTKYLKDLIRHIRKHTGIYIIIKYFEIPNNFIYFIIKLFKFLHFYSLHLIIKDIII